MRLGFFDQRAEFLKEFPSRNFHVQKYTQDIKFTKKQVMGCNCFKTTEQDRPKILSQPIKL